MPNYANFSERKKNGYYGMSIFVAATPFRHLEAFTFSDFFLLLKLYFTVTFSLSSDQSSEFHYY